MVIPRLALLFFLLFGGLAVAQSPEPDATPAAKPLRVAVTGQPPFVSKKGDVYEGVSIDIWEQIAAQNSWSFKYEAFSQEDAIKAVQAGQVDIVVGDVSIVSALLDTLEFSQPYFRSGLQIMITDARPHTIGRLVEDLATWEHLQAFWYILGAIAVSTVLVALFERKHNPDFPKAWKDSLAEAFYYVVSLSLGKSAYKGFGGWFGRLVMVVWTIAGVVVVAYVTSSITSVMTVEKLRSRIAGPQDLPGHTVGVVPYTMAFRYLQRHDIDMRTYPTLPDAVQGLIKGEVSALVGAAPLLQYYDNNNPALPITEVGPIFSPYNYGFALPINSPLHKQLNQGLLALQESGALLDIGRKYFGAVFQP